MRGFVVDCEAYGLCPSVGRLTEVGCVEFDTRAPESEWRSFHGLMYSPKGLGAPVGPDDELQHDRTRSQLVAAMPADEYDSRLVGVFREFDSWLADLAGAGRKTMWSDNPAYDFQWVVDGFARALGRCPFGHSARRIADLYAGLTGDPSKTQEWKRLRRTRHDHDPVNDARGNAEALVRMLRGERA